MIIDCISDLHGHYPKLKGGDLLIIAGDLTKTDTPEEHCDGFCKWAEEQDYKKIIVIAGNHDNLLQEDGCLCIGDYDSRKTEYLQDLGTEFEGLQVWGSPWIKRFKGMHPSCKAFTLNSEEELEEKFRQIPNGIDILVTHGPPFGILDYLENEDHVGSYALKETLKRIRPKLHVFGHIHEAFGKVRPSFNLPWNHLPGYPIFVNASYVNERYEPVNKPIRIEL